MVLFCIFLLPRYFFALFEDLKIPLMQQIIQAMYISQQGHIMYHQLLQPFIPLALPSAPLGRAQNISQAPPGPPLQDR